MSRVLIANDDRKVIKKVAKVISDLDDNIKIIESESYQETFKIIYEDKDIKKVILDITMPTYKIKKHDDGGTFRRSAGIDILNKIELYGLEIDVLLLTRLEQFYDSTDIEKNDFQSIKKDIQNNKWKSCKNIIRFEDNLQVDWKKAINSFILE